jgi:ferrochelatase
MTKTSNTALLLINYGTPESPAKKHVRKFLRGLLDSKHVITMNDFGRKLLVNAVIIPSRLKKSAGMYERLNAEHGMLLRTISENFAAKVQKILVSKADVFTAMTAGYNLLPDVLKEIHDAKYDRIIACPMYPQYTESTWGKALDDLYGFFKGRFNIPVIKVIDPFYDDENYLDAMATLVSKGLENFDYEKIVFSYHGVPIVHEKLAEGGSYNYVSQCQASTRLICEKLGISDEKAVTSFQSRMSGGWTEPYTESTVIGLAKSGIRRIAVVTPSFTADCLETVVEIGKNLRQTFLDCSGEEFRLVPCLNYEDFWAESFCKMIF